MFEPAPKPHHPALVCGVSARCLFHDVRQLRVLTPNNPGDQARQRRQVTSLMSMHMRIQMQQTLSDGTISAVRVAHDGTPFGSLAANLVGNRITCGTYSFQGKITNMFAVR